MQQIHSASRPLQVELEFTVRTYDIDFAGVVSNIVYIRWLEDLRCKCLEEYLPLDKLIEQQCVPVLAGTEIEYKRSIKLFDKVVGRLWISDLGRLKFILHAEIVSNNQLAAKAIQKGAFVNSQSGRPVPIPEKLHTTYSEYQIPPTPCCVGG